MTEVLHCKVNGTGIAAPLAPGQTLLELLRGDLGLTSARYGCGAEHCGACRVAVDGRPVFACTMPAAAAGGTDVLTVEGLDREDPLLRAFEEFQAGQCGYCLTGIVMSLHCLIARGPAPDETAIRAALEPHLCRCGAHARILRAARRAVELAAAGQDTSGQGAA